MSGPTGANRRNESDQFESIEELQAAFWLKKGSQVSVWNNYDYDIDDVTGTGAITINGTSPQLYANQKKSSASEGSVTSVAGVLPDVSGNVPLTKSDLNLGNVDNTSDANKPVSTAQQNALDAKVDKVVGSRLITDAEGSKLSGIGDGANLADVIAGTNVTIDKTDPQNPVINATGGGAGEANTASNLGAGSGLFAQKNGVDLQFKSIKSTDFALSSTATEVSVDLPSGKVLSDNNYDNAAVQEVAKVSGKSDKSVVSEITSGTLPNNASWLVDSSAPRTVTTPLNPVDGERFSAFDSTGTAETNNATITPQAGDTIDRGILDKNGQSREWQYVAASNEWKLVFSDAPTSGGGLGAPTLTPFLVTFGQTTSTALLNFPAGSDVTKTFPIFHNNIGTTSVTSGSEWTRSVITVGLSEIPSNRLRLDRPTSNLGQGGQSGFWLEYASGVSVTYSRVLASFSSGSNSATITIPNSDPSKTIILDLGGNNFNASDRCYTYRNQTATSFDVFRENSTSPDSFNIEFATVEFD